MKTYFLEPEFEIIDIFKNDVLTGSNDEETDVPGENDDDLD